MIWLCIGALVADVFFAVWCVILSRQQNEADLVIATMLNKLQQLERNSHPPRDFSPRFKQIEDRLCIVEGIALRREIPKS